MNQFTQFAQQVQSLFVGMTPQARLLSVLLAAAIAVSAGILVSGSASGTQKTTYLFDGQTFNESQLSRFEVAFSTAGLRDWERVGSRIRIPESTKGVYYKAVSDSKAMPDTPFSAIDEATSGTNLLDSTKLVEARQLNARLKALSNALKTMPFVEEAYVNSDQDRTGFVANRQKTASVAIRPRGNVPLTPAQARHIMQYIQKSVAGLKAADIALLDLASGQTTLGEDDPLILEQERYYQVKRQQEMDLRRRAKELLADYGDIRLEVNVEIDPTLSEETNRMNYDPKSTTISAITSRKDSDSAKNPVAGRPGTGPNATLNQSQSITTPEQVSKAKESTESTKQVVGSTLTSIRKVGLQTKYVSFSVLVPHSYYKRIYKKEWDENPANNGKTIPALDDAAFTLLKEKIETNIKNILTAIIQTSTPGEDKFPRVTVGHYVDFETPEPAPPSLVQKALDWLSESWQTLLLAAVALAGIFSMRGFVKSAPTSNDSAFEKGFDIPLDDALDIDLTGLDDEPVGSLEAGGEGADSNPLRLKTTGGDVKKDLTNMVRENPDAAATLLRNWISGTKE